MTVKRAFTKSRTRLVHMRSNPGDDWRSEGHVWHEVPIHTVDMEPICSLLNSVRACLAK